MPRKIFIDIKHPQKQPEKERLPLKLSESEPLKPETKTEPVLEPEATFETAELKKTPEPEAKNPPKKLKTPPPIKKKRSLWLWLILLLALLGAFYVARLFYLKKALTQSADEIYQKINLVQTALKDFDSEDLLYALTAINQEFQSIESETEKFGLAKIIAWLGNFIKTLGAGTSALDNLANLSAAALDASQNINLIKNNGLHLVLNKKGSELIGYLESTRADLNILISYIDELKFSASTIEKLNEINWDQLKNKVLLTSQFLNALVDYLNLPKSRQIAVFFQNPSEMRPAGGFLGSYAQITLNQASLENLNVRDIYDPDGQLDLKIIPPEPLKRLTPTWEARDANWFFDFPTSAQKVLSFLNASKIYSEKNVVFENAIAINVNVIEDILKIIGPIELKEYNAVITFKNFLPLIQEEVETGPDKAVNQPKKILQILTANLIQKFADLTDEQKAQIATALKKHLNEKDIMVFSADSKLEAYLKFFGLAGEIAAPKPDRVNEYLAVVNANLAGGKTDAVISQNITLKSAIDQNGKIINELSLTRAHRGSPNSPWWYTMTNKNYVQIYAPLGSEVLSTTGSDNWPKIPKEDYSDFKIDPDVKKIEDTAIYLKDFDLDRFIAFNKTVYSFYLNTELGQTRKFNLKYDNPQKINLDNPWPYEFIFEKQSGASTTLNFSISAPPGFIWQENQKAKFEYYTDSPAGRIKIRLNLAKE